MKTQMTDYEAEVVAYVLENLDERMVDKIIDRFGVEEDMERDPFDVIDSVARRLQNEE